MLCISLVRFLLGRSGSHTSHCTYCSSLIIEVLQTMSHQSQDGDSAVLTVARNARADGSRTLTASISLDSIDK